MANQIKDDAPADGHNQNDEHTGRHTARGTRPVGEESLSTRLSAVLAAIDEANAGDPNRFDGRPLAQSEGNIASAWIDRLSPDATDELRIAARAHHLRRWVVPRADYPEGRSGYLRWRRDQKRRHAAELAELMAAAGYDPAARDRTANIVMKRRLMSDIEVRAYEDAVALTFLETQFESTADRLDDDHMVRVLAKTMAKMTPAGLAAAAALPSSRRGASRSCSLRSRAARATASLSKPLEPESLWPIRSIFTTTGCRPLASSDFNATTKFRLTFVWGISSGALLPLAVTVIWSTARMMLMTPSASFRTFSQTVAN